MKLADPYLLLLLAPLLFVWRLRALRPASAMEKKRLPMLIFSVACLILAIAKPYWSTTTEKRISKGADFIVLLDVSQSMFCPTERGLTRIDEARNFLHQLLPQFSGSSMAVIYFAGDAQIGCPLTDDLSAVNLFLDSISPAMTAKPGTDPDQLRQTLADFLESLKASPIHNPKRQIGLLFSDGEFSTSADSLAGWARKQKTFMLFAFQCGKEKAAVPNFKLTSPYPGAFSQPSPQTLKVLSTGSFYNLAEGVQPPLLADISDRVNDVVAAGRQIPLYQYAPFLILAFCFLLGYQLYPALARLGRNAGIGASFAALLLAFSTLSMTTQQKTDLYQEAMKMMAAKKYDEAIQKLQVLRKEGETEEVEISIGNAYLAQKKYDQAISSYEHAVELNPQNRVARWNWEVALKRQQNPHNDQPPPPPRQQPPPQQMPKETQALLKYFDQQEKEQMQLTNSINAHNDRFAW